jgi:hypothetical protein
MRASAEQENMLTLENVQRARRVLGQVRALRLNEANYIDLSDRLGLASVVLGLRTVAGFGFAEHNDGKAYDGLREVLSRNGLQVWVTASVDAPPAPGGLSPQLVELFEAIDRELDREQSARGDLLWVSSSEAALSEIHEVVAGRTASGVLLGYPECCVKRRDNAAVEGTAHFRKAIIEVVGIDPKAIERALRENLKVPIPFDPDQGASATAEKYPFVFHIACQECLSNEDSPTANLNKLFEDAARRVDRSLWQGIIDMAEVEAKIVHVISEAEVRGVGPGKLEPAVRARLDELYRQTDRIRARAIAP